MAGRVRPVVLAIAVAAMTGAVALAWAGPEPLHWAGGPVTPLPVRVTVNPSAPPMGDAVPTGIVVRRQEMILYFCCGPRYPWLTTVWRDPDTGRITAMAPIEPAVPDLESGALVPDPVFALNELVVGDGTVIEYGAVRGPAALVVVRPPGGPGVAARFARWSQDPSVAIFWVHRRGAPVPPDVRVRGQVYQPLAPERYPLVSAYDGTGRLVASARIRPSGYGFNDG